MALCINKNNSFAHGIMNGQSNDRNADQPSSACTASVANEAIEAGVLTYATIPGGPLAVATGQIIQITVTITFS